MIQLLIIADDFTGALDSGIQLAEQGARTRVMIGSKLDQGAMHDDCDVLVIDAETRHLSARKAFTIVADITRTAINCKIPHIFKKTDSALRGNIGAELTALLSASGEKQLPFVPSYPQIGRTTENGICLINGTPVAESVFGADPFEPVTESNVAALIALQSDIRSIVLGVPVSGETIPSEEGILIFDGHTEKDLSQILEVLKGNCSLRIMAGCAGFASVLPGIFRLSGQKQENLPEMDPRLLVVCGSVNPITVEQLNRAEEKGFFRYRLSPEQKLKEGYWESSGGAAAKEMLRTILAENAYMIIDSNDMDNNESTREYARRHDIDLDEVRLSITRAVASIIKALIDCPSLGTMLITGGDTLFMCMQRFDAYALEPVMQLEPGIVLCRFIHRDQTRYIITKSGGFGNKDLIVNIAGRLAEQQENGMF